MALAKREYQVTSLTASSVILDIEGTTSSISFVKDVLFPYVRNNLDQYLNENWNTADFEELVKALRKQAQQDVENKVEGVVLIPEEGEEDTLKAAVIENIKWQMDNDRKTKSLKDLQGVIMEKGYKSGDLKGHVYEDVVQSLKSWVESDKSVYIYSSGSVNAQKLLFGHSEKGDLLPLIKGHFDTTVGMKGDVNSYKEILKQISTCPSETAFFTDVPKEARAAKGAGILAILVSREGNAPLSDEDKAEFQVITSFEDIEFEQNCKKRKTSSENPVNIDNKEVVSCSLSIDKTNKPLSPQIVRKIESKCMGGHLETSTEQSNGIKSIDTCSNNADESMDVDESPSERASIDEIKTNKNANDTNQEDNTLDNMEKKTMNSDNENHSSIPEEEGDQCKLEVKKMEAVDNTSENKKEEAHSSDSSPTNKDTTDVECKNQVGEHSIGSNEQEAINSDSKLSSNEISDNQSKIETDKIDNLIGNHKEETVHSDAVISNIKCKNENEELCVENIDKLTSNSESENVESAVKEELAKPTCINGDKIENSEDMDTSVGNPHISHETNTIIEEKSLSGSEEKSISSGTEDNLKSDEEPLKKEEHLVEEAASISTDSKNENLNCGKIEGSSKFTSSQEILTEEALQISATAEKHQVGKEMCIIDEEETKKEYVPEPCNGVENDNVEGNDILKQDTVEITDEIQSNSNLVSESAISLKENGGLDESQNDTSSIMVDCDESRCNKETSKISEESNADIKLDQPKDDLSIKADVVECDKKSHEILQTIESNGLIHVVSTHNETEVPLLKKTEDKSKEAVNELQDDKQEDDKTIKVASQNGQISNGNLNGISSPDLKTEDNGSIEEIALEDKKCNSSENTPVETVIEA